MLLSHIKLAHELRKDAEEGLRVGCFAVFSKVGGGLAEFLQRSLLQRLQRLDRWVAVLQEILCMPPSRKTKASEGHSDSSLGFPLRTCGRRESPPVSGRIRS